MLRPRWTAVKLAVTTVMLTWIFYATLAEMVWMVKPVGLPTVPVCVLEPFRIANRYGLLAVMARGRYESDVQGAEDGQTWLVYRSGLYPAEASALHGDVAA